MFALPVNIGEQRRPNPALSNVQSVQFDGANDYVAIGQPTDMNITPNAAPITLSAWFKPSDISNQRFIMARAQMSTATISYVLAVNSDGSVYATVGGVSNGSGSLVVNTWNHIALTVRNVATVYTYFLFLNGVQVGTGIAGVGIASTMDWLIGASRWDTNSSDSYPYQGDIDEVSMWNNAFSNSEVLELYNSGVPGNPKSHSRARFLKHWYRMGDGDTYPNITDQVGTAHGTCTNMVDSGNIVNDVP